MLHLLHATFAVSASERHCTASCHQACLYSSCVFYICFFSSFLFQYLSCVKFILKIDHTCTTNQKCCILDWNVSTVSFLRYIWPIHSRYNQRCTPSGTGATQQSTGKLSQRREMEYPQDCKVVVLGTTGVRYITHCAVVNLICGGVVWCDTPLLTALINEGRYNISIYLFCLFPHLLFFIKAHTTLNMHLHTPTAANCSARWLSKILNAFVLSTRTRSVGSSLVGEEAHH